ncbi:hypothetical protein KFE25_013733 [Diacronema lutheri]|uniref:Uncharacterized protein n=2 Tax=Diacronema lutheri TaxID=2081491 RepID=A0A8J6CG37_DIALT|nr:hypothetical protein KFE25_013733 [Diacronema lutheri]
MSDGGERPNKWIALFSSCYMCVVAGGIMYGWPSLLLMLQAEGQYAELCVDVPAPCAAQESLYHWIWTISSSACLASNLLTGLLLDALGPRFSATVCSLLVLLGCALIGVHDSRTCNVLQVGMVLISAFGPGVQNACVHTSNLFERRSTASSMIIGSFNLSYAVFLILELISRTTGATRHDLVLGYCALVVGACVLAFVVMPAKPFSTRTRTDAERLLAGDSASPKQSSPQAAAATLAVGRARRETLVTVLLSEAPLHHQVMSSPFLNLLVWTTIAMFWMNFYIGTVASRLGHGGSVQIVGAHRREAFIELFNLLSPAGVIALPFIGYIFDRVSFSLGLLVTTVFGALFAALLLVPSEATLVGAWVAYTLFRNCAFASLFSTLTHFLGFQNLGVLVGLTLLVSGCVSMFQPLIIKLIDMDLMGQYTYVNYFMFGSMLCLFYFPAWAFFREQRMKRTDSTDSITIAIST